MTAMLLEAPNETRTAPSFYEDEIDVPKGFEFVDGELRELNVSTLSSFVAGRIYSRIDRHIEIANAGWLFPEGTSFKCFPDKPGKVRRADGAFHRLDRLTREQALSEGYCTVVPDLAVEVISPNDLFYEVDEKRDEWLGAGAKLVWIVNPKKRRLTAYRPDAPPREYVIGDTLTAEPVLPEFRVPLEEIFRLPKAAGV